MGSIVRRIIFTNKAPAPLAPYSQGVLVDKTLYISGQIGLDVSTGQLGDGIEAQTKLALQNMGSVLEAAGGTYKNVVKATVLMADISHSPIVNKIYGTYFTGDCLPARAAFQVAKLPRDALIEIEAVAVIGDIIEAKL